MQLINIQDPAIDLFAGRPVFIDVFILGCSPWDRSIKTDIPFELCINTAVVGGDEQESLQEQFFSFLHAIGDWHLQRERFEQNPQ